MGVHTLWDLLAKAGEENMKVTALRGKRLAVDLSAWIVELKQSKVSLQLHNAYIRNLFFRTLYFMKQGVELVFVIDGRAPELKQQALLTRQQNQFGSSSVTANPDRPFLKNAVSQCVEMLGYLGLPCIQSDGEAEAMCARLNSEGLVDGCLTEDNDFFLYGGKTLYRKLRRENKTYFVDEFNLEKIKDETELDRRDLVALALLLGSDYDDQKGVKCVGKEKGRALVELLKSRNLDVLDRLLHWRENKELDSIEEQLSAKVKHHTHCSKCDHLGRVSSHETSGCDVCQTDRGCHGSCDVMCQCEWHEQEALKTEHKLEISLRQKSLENSSFPNIQIVNEFLDPYLTDCKTIPRPSLDLPNLTDFLKKTLRWSCDDVLEKMVPVIILKQLYERRNQSYLLFTPVRIVRACKENHVMCYEVAWDKTDQNDWAGAKFSTNILEKVEKNLFDSAYPEMAANFEQYQTQKKSAGGKKRKTETGKGQMKLTDYTKIKKRLQFNEEVKTKSQGTGNVNTAGNCFVDLMEFNSKKKTDFAELTAVKKEIDSKSLDTLPDVSVDSTFIDLTGSDIDRKPEMYELAVVKSGTEQEHGKTDYGKPNTELGHSKTNTEEEHGRSAGKEIEASVFQKSQHKWPSAQKGKSMCKSEKSGGKKSRKKTSEVYPQTSIVSFFQKKGSGSEPRTVEFQQNNTDAFRVINSSSDTR